jgi:probable HAF family extracellular repeat protein
MAGKIHFWAALITVFTLLALTAAFAQSNISSITCTYTTFQGSPHANLGSQANSINDVDTVAGTWSEEDKFLFVHVNGFLRSSNGHITQVSYPNMPFTYLNGINQGGTVVGYYQPSSNNLSANGFSWSQGKFTALQYPNSVYTEPYGINKTGDVVGWQAPSGSPGTGFLYSAGNFSSIAYPGAFSTVAAGINNSGEIVGWWEDSNLNKTAFIYSGGQFQNVNFPGENQTFFTAVNDSGEIAGYYVGPGPQYLSHGFVYENGIFKLLNIPNSFASQALGINNNGDISGFYAIKHDRENQAFIGTSCH